MAKIRTTVLIANTEIPLDLYIERRASLRVAFGRDAVIVRLPKDLSEIHQRGEYERAKKWISEKVNEKPYLLQQYVSDFLNKEEIRIQGVDYRVDIIRQKRNTAAGRIVGQEVKLILPDRLSSRDESELVKKLLSKIFAERHKNGLIERVTELNRLTVQKKIKAVRLKYNKSNWGSCSSDNNINLSTRLLLVPKNVRDYVIIHELCHLIEMNHSKSFWKLVQTYCPNYKIYDKWLDTEGVKLDF